MQGLGPAAGRVAGEDSMSPPSTGQGEGEFAQPGATLWGGTAGAPPVSGPGGSGGRGGGGGGPAAAGRIVDLAGQRRDQAQSLEDAAWALSAKLQVTQGQREALDAHEKGLAADAYQSRLAQLQNADDAALAAFARQERHYEQLDALVVDAMQARRQELERAIPGQYEERFQEELRRAASQSSRYQRGREAITANRRERDQVRRAQARTGAYVARQSTTTLLGHVARTAAAEGARSDERVRGQARARLDQRQAALEARAAATKHGPARLEGEATVMPLSPAETRELRRLRADAPSRKAEERQLAKQAARSEARRDAYVRRHGKQIVEGLSRKASRLSRESERLTEEAAGLPDGHPRKQGLTEESWERWKEMAAANEEAARIEHFLRHGEWPDEEEAASAAQGAPAVQVEVPPGCPPDFRTRCCAKCKPEEFCTCSGTEEGGGGGPAPAPAPMVPSDSSPPGVPPPPPPPPPVPAPPAAGGGDGAGVAPPDAAVPAAKPQVQMLDPCKELRERLAEVANQLAHVDGAVKDMNAALSGRSAHGPGAELARTGPGLAGPGKRKGAIEIRRGRPGRTALGPGREAEHMDPDRGHDTPYEAVRRVVRDEYMHEFGSAETQVRPRLRAARAALAGGASARECADQLRELALAEGHLGLLAASLGMLGLYLQAEANAERAIWDGIGQDTKQYELWLRYAEILWEEYRNLASSDRLPEILRRRSSAWSAADVDQLAVLLVGWKLRVGVWALALRELETWERRVEDEESAAWRAMVAVPHALAQEAEKAGIGLGVGAGAALILRGAQRLAGTLVRMPGRVGAVARQVQKLVERALRPFRDALPGDRSGKRSPGLGEGTPGLKPGEWRPGAHHSETQWANKMADRGWTPKSIDEAIEGRTTFPAENRVNPGNSATRYVHPKTGRSVVIDDVTKDVLYIEKEGHVNPWSK